MNRIYEQIAKGFKEELWDKNHRLRAAHVIAQIAYEYDPQGNFDSFEFFKACGLVEHNEEAA